MEYKVIVQWTETAKTRLAELPKKVRQGLIEKVERLRNEDPRKTYKQLAGPLQGHFSIPYSRYRLLYRVTDDPIADGSVLLYVRVTVVYAGIRKERDRNDVYRLARKLVELGLVGDGVDVGESEIELRDEHGNEIEPA